MRQIKKGELDIIVGTHSLLGNRVVYNNLGLLVVDEEQVCLLSSSYFVNEDYVYSIFLLLAFMFFFLPLFLFYYVRGEIFDFS